MRMLKDSPHTHKWKGGASNKKEEETETKGSRQKVQHSERASREWVLEYDEEYTNGLSTLEIKVTAGFSASSESLYQVLGTIPPALHCLGSARMLVT